MFAQFGNTSFTDGTPAIFMLVFVAIGVLILGSIIFVLGQGISEWMDNNQQPILTVRAKMVAKRAATSVSSSHHQVGNNHCRTSSSTSYFATFEFESGDRKEFSLSSKEYGLLAEGDSGELTFQGTRYQGFRRETAPQQMGALVSSETALATESLADQAEARVGEWKVFAHIAVRWALISSFVRSAGDPSPNTTHILRLCGQH